MSHQAKQLTEQLDRIQSLEREDILALWHKAYDSPPFKGARRGTLLRGVSYAEQTKAQGALKAKTRRKLIKIARAAAVSSVESLRSEVGTGACKGRKSLTSAKPALPTLQLGSQIVREWNGKTYTVHSTDQGFVLNGVTYTSLSAVAKAITGAHWSGPRFFGVSG
jgi:hypothetical protein